MREITIPGELGAPLRFVQGLLRIVFRMMSVHICTMNRLSETSYSNP